MGVTARFGADFASFVSAVDKADAKLADFAQGAGKVEKALTRMVDTFSGRKLIQDATLMAEAVERIGGVSKLTAAQLEQVGNKAAEAALKMKAMGIDVPQNIQSIATHAKAASGNLGAMMGTASSLAGAFGIAFSVGQVVSFGRELLRTADELTRLHDKTGVTIEGLQRFQVAGDDAGNSLEEITAAITKMQDTLVSGTDSAKGALDKLGLSFADLKGLTPENQFIAILGCPTPNPRSGPTSQHRHGPVRKTGRECPADPEAGLR